MKIIFNNNYNSDTKPIKPIKSDFNNRFITYPKNTLNADTVCFTGVKPVKRINIENEKQKLLRTITKLLETDTSGRISKFDADTLAMRSLLFLESKDKKMDLILEQAKILGQSQSANPTMLYEMHQSLLNQAKKIQKDANNYQTKIKLEEKKDSSENWDYALLNKFKSAIMNGNFDLKQVMEEHYSGLSNIYSQADVKDTYPVLNPLVIPEEVISQNIMKSLDRNFYETVHEKYSADDLTEVTRMLTNVLMSSFVNLAEQSGIVINDLPNRVATLFANQVMAKMHQCVKQGSFSSIPEHIKKIPPIANKLDLDLAQIDFDKFVLDVYKQQFVDMKKLNEIVYEENGIKIPVKTLVNSPYKFEKLSEKIRSIIKDSEKLKTAQRDYDNFNIEELKSRLNYFSNQLLCDNDVIFESIMEFYSSSFLPEDITNLKILLKELDLIIDKKKPIEDVVFDIQHKKIKPIGTQKLNEAERLEAYEKIKAEQQKAYELSMIQDDFDRVVNTLYTLQMNTVASACAEFRPQSLDDIKNIERAEFLIKYAKDNLIDEKNPNKNKIENDIFYWDAYLQYKSGSSYIKHPQYQELIKNAEKYSTKNGVFDPIKAGQYIFNMEIITTYPESANVVDDAEILHSIMGKTNGDKQKALYYLVKYDEYENLREEDQYKINKILEIFDLKDNVDKAIIKQILESKFLENDTLIPMIDSKKDEVQIVAITKEAKQQIYNKYKFPTCIDLFEAFETAAQTFTADVGTSGVKRVGGTNLSLPYKFEVKIKGYPDRLFSSKNDYKFDVYSEKGLH